MSTESNGVGSFEIADMTREAVEATVPEARFVSRQVGCSDLGALFVAFDVRDGLPENIQRWIGQARERAAWGTKKSPPVRVVATWAAMKSRLVRTPVGQLPEIIATKAGLRAKSAQASYAKSGEDLEERLLNAWRRTLSPDSEIDPDSIRTQHDVRRLYPSEWMPTIRMPSIRCPDLPELVTYGPDAWGRSRWPIGEPIVINAKCSRDEKHEPDPPAWLQLQAEGMCCGATALLVLGEMWLADHLRSPPEQRPIRVWPIEEHAGTRAAIAHVVRRTIEAIDDADARFREMNRKQVA